jgi:hypothetical protein
MSTIGGLYVEAARCRLQLLFLRSELLPVLILDERSSYVYQGVLTALLQLDLVGNWIELRNTY